MEKVKNINPRVNIIFVTVCSEKSRHAGQARRQNTAFFADFRQIRNISLRVVQEADPYI